MNDFKLKLVLSLLGGIAFSFLFILLAFAVPVKDTPDYVKVLPKGKLEQVAHSYKNR